MLQSVNINILDNQTGRTNATTDGLTGFILQHNGDVSSVASLNVPTQVFSIDDVENLGITSDAFPDHHKQLDDFYAETGDGTELWLLITNDLDTNNVDDKLKTLLDKAKGKLNHVGLMDGTLSKQANGNIAAEYLEYATKMQQVAELYADKNQYFIGFIDAGDFDDPTTIESFETQTKKYVVFVLSGNELGYKGSNLGQTLGIYATLPVQTSIARVDRGGINITNATFSNGVAIEEYASMYALLQTKRYLFIGQYGNLDGYYYANDLNLAQNSSDFSSIARVRKFNKVLRILDAYFTNESHKELLVDTETGLLDITEITRLQSGAENVVSLLMQQTGNTQISGIEVELDEENNVLATDTIVIRAVKVTGLAYGKSFEIYAGFNNPAA